MRRPWVIKVGGSLDAAGTLGGWLDTIGRLRDVVLVPGGGVFADTVRAQQSRHGFDDGTAHTMALLAMDQYGLQLIALAGGHLRAARDAAAITEVLFAHHVPVWLPAAQADPDPSIERSWAVTSDSLALWLAQSLDAAGVVVIKSMVIDEGAMASQDAARRGWVDDAFARLRADFRGPVRLLGAGGQTALSDIVAGGAGGLELR